MHMRLLWMPTTVRVCASVCVAVPNVIETNKINANYLVFQFVTLHYCVQLINGHIFVFFLRLHGISSNFCLFFFSVLHFLVLAGYLNPGYPSDLLIVLYEKLNSNNNSSSSSRKQNLF